MLTKLPRRLLCALYTYSTQSYQVTNDILRNPALRKRLDVVLGGKGQRSEWSAFVPALTDGRTPQQFVSSFVNKDTRARSHADKLLTLVNELKLALAALKTSSKQSYAADMAKYNAKARTLSHFCRAHATMFIPKFHSTLRTSAATSGAEGVVFYDQAKRVLGIAKLSDWIDRLPAVTNVEWNKIFDTFVADVDEAIERMPATDQQVVLFRGFSEPKAVAKVTTLATMADPAYASTSLDKTVATTFAKGSGGSVKKIEVPIGSRIAPLVGITRYPFEKEILLPRGWT